MKKILLSVVLLSFSISNIMGCNDAGLTKANPSAKNSTATVASSVKASATPTSTPSSTASSGASNKANDSITANEDNFYAGEPVLPDNAMKITDEDRQYIKTLKDKYNFPPDYAATAEKTKGLAGVFKRALTEYDITHMQCYEGICENNSGLPEYYKMVAVIPNTNLMLINTRYRQETLEKSIDELPFFSLMDYHKERPLDYLRWITTKHTNEAGQKGEIAFNNYDTFEHYYKRVQKPNNKLGWGWFNNNFSITLKKLLDQFESGKIAPIT